MERFIAIVERLAGLCLAAVAALTFTNVVLRGVFNVTLPDWYDISRLLLGITVFWGIATTSFRGDHIDVDLLWRAVGPRGRRLIEIVSTAIVFVFLLLFAWKLAEKVASVMASGEATFDTRMPIWPFHLVASLGIFAAVVLVGIRLLRLLRRAPSQDPHAHG